MKASIYFNYTTRSLWRGGQRTVLALFCIAVGVMSIVALQLVGQMINNSFQSNVRDVNGGDLTVSAFIGGIKPSDLPFFDKLKSNDTILSYTPVIQTNGSFGSSSKIGSNSFSVDAVNPATYPVVTPPSFNTPSDGSIAGLLKNNQVIIDQKMADQYHKKVGDSLNVTTSSGQGAKSTMTVKVAGIVADNGVLSSQSSVLLISLHDYQALNPDAEIVYSSVSLTTADQAHTDKAEKAVHNQFPLLNTQTASDALKQQQSTIDLVKKFLEIAGLLALLIGGVGIVNTMQVLLSRRKIEIAMLKTTGYRRMDLYLLFGLEAGLLGLVGGVIGVLVSIGVSYLVLLAVQHLLGLIVPFVLDPFILGGGVLIGFCTALIFGLMPIVQAANIRPLNVIRDMPGDRQFGSIALTILLVLILSVLFCIMSSVILNSALWGISAVYGTFVFLGLLSLIFTFIVWIIGRLPVPERFSWGYAALVVIPLLLSLAIALVLPAFGGVLAFVALMGILVVLMPRSWKVSIKMALRNIGRQRARTTTTLLALFVGVFTIGLVMSLAQNLREEIDTTLANNLSFNVAVSTQGSETQALNNGRSSIPGLQHVEQHYQATTVPVSIDGQSLNSLVLKDKSSNANVRGIILLSGLGNAEGYDLAHNQLPKVDGNIQGRALKASDANTDNVMISQSIVDGAKPTAQIKLGSTILLTSPDGKLQRTVHVVGIFSSSVTSSFSNMLAPLNTITELSAPGKETSSFSMKIDTNSVDKAISRINQLAPHASVFNLADIGGFIDQIISNILWMLTTLASLSLLAGVIIIANAVALAMLERRRELGILKSVGYTSQSLLGEVLVENGIVGGVGALLAMLLVTFCTSLLGTLVFKTSFGVSWYIAIGLIGGIALLAIITALLVAWQSVRVRPLEVLRYE